jgi:hypothetical protein
MATLNIPGGGTNFDNTNTETAVSITSLGQYYSLLFFLC